MKQKRRQLSPRATLQSERMLFILNLGQTERPQTPTAQGKGMSKERLATCPLEGFSSDSLNPQGFAAAGPLAG